MSDTPEPRGVRISVTIPEADYLRLEALKARRRTSRSGPASTQEIVSTWITEALDRTAAEDGRKGGAVYPSGGTDAMRLHDHG